MTYWLFDACMLAIIALAFGVWRSVLVGTPMRTLVKRVVIGAYCRGLISSRTVEKLFYWLALSRH